MSITATVENDMIRLPVDLHLPDGTQVRVETLDAQSSVSAMRDWLREAGGKATPGITTDEIMKETRGEE